MWDAVLDAVLDTLKLLPFLFVLYILIELMEHNTGVGRPRRALTGKWAVPLGAGLGVVPMCGFSVMAAKLYEHRHITVGTLVAVLITTSDEAVLVLLLSAMPAVPKLLSAGALILSKLALGIAVGYLCDLLFKHRGALAPLPEGHHGHFHEADAHGHIGHTHAHDVGHTEHEGHTHVRGGDVTEHEEHAYVHDIDHADHEGHTHAREGTLTEHGEQEGEETHERGDCACNELSPCEHKKENKLTMYFLSPLLHALQVAAFVLIVNLVFGLLLAWLGEARVADFLQGTAYWLQPLLCAFIGAIPNCASSVILAEVFALGGIGFGGLLGGLVVNAGLGYLVLLKREHRVRGLVILGGMLLLGVAVGYAASALALLL